MAVWFTHSHHTLILHHQQHKLTSSYSCSSPKFPKSTACCCSCSSLLSTPSSSPSSCCSILGKKKCGVHYMSKRMLNLSLLTLISPCSSLLTSIAMAEEVGTAGELELQKYTDSVEGFTLLVDKAGATVLFEEANKGTNNVGVVVSPVRLTNLGEFGNPQFVADKLIQAEKQKESTKDAEVMAFSDRSGQGGLQVYKFEYKVDSTRGGMKRIFSAAFVASKKLHLLNIAHSDKPESPLDAHRRLILEQVLHSFETA